MAEQESDPKPVVGPQTRDFELPNIPDILKAVTTPLIFFALALIVLEVALAYVVTHLDLSEPNKMIVLGYMAGLFLVVVALVFYLTVKLPENLRTALNAAITAMRGG